MKIQVLYHSSTGNTKKVAEAIGAAVGVQAEQITAGHRLTEPVDLLFIGDGIYAGKANKKTMNFIASLDSALVKKAAVFGTFGGEDTAIALMRKLLSDKGIPLCAESFSCKGKAFFFANKQHPNQEELEQAAAFGRACVNALDDSSK